MTEKKKEPLLVLLTSGSVWLALLINILTNMAGSCVSQPVNLMGSDLGMTASLIGFVTSCYTVCAMLIRTPFGSLIDSAKKPKMVLFWSTIITSVVYIGFAVCKSVPMFIVLRFLHGATFGMRNMAMAVVLAKSVDKNAFGSALGLLTLFPKIVSAITTKITLWVKQTAGIEYCCYAAAIIGAIAAVLCLFLKMESTAQNTAGKKGGKKPFYFKALPIICIFAIVQIPSIASNSFVVLYGKAVDMADAAGTFVANQGLWMGIAAFALGYITDKISWKHAKLVGVVACVAAALGGILVGAFQNASIWLIAGVLTGIGSGGCMIYRSVSLRESSPEVRALAVGSFAMAQDFVMLIGSFAIGALADTIGYSSTFVVLGCAPVISLLLTLFCFDKFMNYMQSGVETSAEG